MWATSSQQIKEGTWYISTVVRGVPNLHISVSQEKYVQCTTVRTHVRMMHCCRSIPYHQPERPRRWTNSWTITSQGQEGVGGQAEYRRTTLAAGVRLDDEASSNSFASPTSAIYVWLWMASERHPLSLATRSELYYLSTHNPQHCRCFQPRQSPD